MSNAIDITNHYYVRELEVEIEQQLLVLRRIVKQADEKLENWRSIFGSDESKPLAVQIDWSLIEEARSALPSPLMTGRRSNAGV